MEFDKLIYGLIIGGFIGLIIGIIQGRRKLKNARAILNKELEEINDLMDRLKF